MLSANHEHSMIIAGRSHPLLAKEVADHLGLALGDVTLENFPDGEISFQVGECVRGKDVFVLQTISGKPNDYLVELLIMIDALKRASAKNIVAVIPYFGYCRQDRKDKPRVPITTKLVANLLEKAGANRLLTMDLHAPQVQGFFDIPVDHLYGRPKLAEAFEKYRLNDLTVVAADIGSIKLTRAYADFMDASFAIVDKLRKTPDEIGSSTVIGNVEGKDILLADDMCSTAGTLASAAKACREKGCKRVFAAVTHGLFVGDALQKIETSPIEKLFVSNTINCADRLSSAPKIEVVSVASLFADAISCIVAKESISSFYRIEKLGRNL